MQTNVFTWTNANPAVAHNINCGFTVAEVTTVDTTNGGSWYWNSQMANASSLDVDSGAYSGSNGLTPRAQSAAYVGSKGHSADPRVFGGRKRELFYDRGVVHRPLTVAP